MGKSESAERVVESSIKFRTRNERIPDHEKRCQIQHQIKMSLARNEAIASDDSPVWNMLHIIAECADLRQTKEGHIPDIGRLQSFIKSLPVMLNERELERFQRSHPPPKSDFLKYFAAMHTHLLHVVHHSSQSCTVQPKAPWRGGPQQWGPIFWAALHHLAENSADNAQGRMMFILNFEITLPCEICSKDTSKIVDMWKPQLDEIVMSREKTTQLFRDIHDQVNKKLGKPMFQKSVDVMSDSWKKGLIGIAAVSVIGIVIYIIYSQTRKPKSYHVA